MEKASASGDKRKITVFGRDQKSTQDALDEIFLDRLSIPVEASMIEQVCGNNDANLHFFTKKSGTVHLTVEKDRGNFLLQAIGTRRSLEILRTIVQTQINLYKDMD